jgi:CheY-like chemotaxis protein
MKNTLRAQKDIAKILVADDDQILCQLIESLLLSYGHICTCVTDGVAAIELLQKESFDMVISDIEMPRLNGLELLAHIKKNHPSIKIIIISGKYFPENTKNSLYSSGVHHFLAKPFSIDLFLYTVHTVLQQQI